MRYFLDTEFIENGRDTPIHLISIGIVSQDGREYYAESSQFPSNKANGWVRKNVLPHLQWAEAKSPIKIAEEIAIFIGYGEALTEKPEFWGYYCDYDWVVFCQLFGSMTDLPPGWPMYCRDLKQWCDQLGNPQLPEQGKGEHHALADARWNKSVWDFLAARKAKVKE